MRLISVHVTGYKRFAAPSTMWVNSPLVAIVGPNEAGKTSLLRAVEHLSREETRFARTEYTGRVQPPDNPAIVSARFAVEDADRQATGDLLDPETGYVLTLSKSPRDDHAVWSLKPPLYRDAEPRTRVEALARKAVEGELLIKRTPIGDGSDEDIIDTELHDLFATLAQTLADAEEDLETDELQQLRAAVEALQAHAEKDQRKPVGEMLKAADELIPHEAAVNPHDQAGETLLGRTPKFLFFSEPHRTLQTNYEWADHETATAALDNLCHLAGIDFGQYRTVALDRERRDELQTMERAANAQLEREFEVWKQAELSVTFRADPQGLQLQVFDKKALRDVPFDQRSAGLRAFVALFAFAARYATGIPPILLIDEAEMHLHYGGQADLVQVFERQKLAQTIIYTTHSVGCLPEDLGSTIRVVAPTGEERSEIRNSFWEGGAGLTPLQLAMGATMLAFTPSRFAVIGEGPTEAILLPSLLREARDACYDGRPLGFQVAPGISEVPEEAAADLELDAGNVAYLIDADKGGRDHSDKLASRVKAEGRLVELGDGTEKGLCIEDFVAKGVYADAVNAVLKRTRTTSDAVSADELPEVARPTSLKEWCSARGLAELSKTLIAQEALVVARTSNRSLVEPARRAEVAALYERLRKVLKIPSAA
jgi:predicted ATP-dependent endonuclease of OLD family